MGKLKATLVVLLLSLVSCSDSVTTENETNLQDPVETIPTLELESEPNTELTTFSNLCNSTSTSSTGNISSGDLAEISGAVWTSDGIWAHNDAGNSPRLHLVAPPSSDNQGAIIRSIDLEGKTPSPVLDPEDITLIDGDLLLADTGNNFGNGGREFVQLVRVSPTTTEVVETYSYSFPEGNGDAEAAFFDPVDRTVFVIEKARDIGTFAGTARPANIYSASLSSGSIAPLNLVGQLDLGEESQSLAASIPPNRSEDLLAVITAADISSDGSLIAIRTYETVWLFERLPGQSVIDALQTTPCELAGPVELQGEAISFNQANNEFELLTLSEGQNQSLNLLTVS